MPVSRIIGAGAAFSAILALAVAGAAAQTAPTGSIGAPLPLLQIGHQTSKERIHPHPKPVKLANRPAKSAAKRRSGKPELVRARKPARKPLVEARHGAPARPTVAGAAAATVAPTIWPAVDLPDHGNAGNSMPPALGSEAAGASEQPTGTISTVAVVDTAPNEIVGGDHTVQTVTGGQGSGPAAAANAPQAGTDSSPTVASATAKSGGGVAGSLQAAQAALPATPAVAAPVPAAPAAAAKVAGAASAPAASAPVVHAMMASGQSTSQVGSASWIAQLLAALAGAVAAGVVAWLLMRPAPQRSYE